MIRSTEKMTETITGILNGNVHSVWLYGSAVMNDFRPGWSDIDLLVLADRQMTESQAERLLTLRQTMAEADPANLYYRSFEGIIAEKSEYLRGEFTGLVYWGTTGQKITRRYQQDVFSTYELAKYGRSVYGLSDRKIFPVPSGEEMAAGVRRHFETIRRCAVQTDEKLYSCGWLLDIARCIYTLRYNEIIAKTEAGFWALSEHLFEDEEPLKRTLEIRQNPLKYKDRDDVIQWLRNLGPVVQRYADVLERELTEPGSKDMKTGNSTQEGTE